MGSFRDSVNWPQVDPNMMITSPGPFSLVRIKQEFTTGFFDGYSNLLFLILKEEPMLVYLCYLL